jgi:hypothetical protein
MRDAGHRRGQAKVGDGYPLVGQDRGWRCGLTWRPAQVFAWQPSRSWLFCGGETFNLPRWLTLTPPYSSSILLSGSTASSVGEIDSTRAGHQKIAVFLWSISRGEREWADRFVWTLRPRSGCSRCEPESVRCSRYVREPRMLRLRRAAAGCSRSYQSGADKETRAGQATTKLERTSKSRKSALL